MHGTNNFATVCLANKQSITCSFISESHVKKRQLQEVQRIIRISITKLAIQPISLHYTIHHLY